MRKSQIEYPDNGEVGADQVDKVDIEFSDEDVDEYELGDCIPPLPDKPDIKVKYRRQKNDCTTINEESERLE